MVNFLPVMLVTLTVVKEPFTMMANRADIILSFYILTILLVKINVARNPKKL